MLRIATRALVLAGLLLGTQAGAEAGITTIMDQIGPDASHVQGNGADGSQNFGSGNSQFNLAVIDNFSITSANTQLVEVDAAVQGFNGFNSFADVTGWQVAVYSSVSAAANSGTNLTGDVFNTVVAPAGVSLTAPFGTDESSGMVQIPINVTLGVGTYFIAVIADLDFNSSGQLGVYESSFAGTPSDFNADQVNPGGGFGLPDNIGSLGANAAYRILAVPEPSSVLLLSTGLGIAGFWRFRRGRVSLRR